MLQTAVPQVPTVAFSSHVRWLQTRGSVRE